MATELKAPTIGGNITPQMPKEPPKEVLEQTFSLDPSIKIGEHSGQTISNDEGKKIETVVTPKVEVVVKPAVPLAKTDESFDYTGFSQQEVVNLKNMSRQSREFAAKLIHDNKQLAGLKDSNYLQHEQGYTLSPEYQDLQSKAYMANVEGQAWKQQLLNIRAGKPFRDVIGFNDNGTPKFGDEQPATDEADIRLSNNMQKCMSFAQQYQGQLQNIPQQFKQRIATDLQAMHEVQKQQFSWVRSEERR